MEIVTCFKEETDISYKQIVDLLHDSFQERLEQGLHYTCSYITEEEYIQKTKGGSIFVAVDLETGDLAGTSTLNIYQDNKSKYGYMEYVAIANKYKHQGVGSLLLQRLRHEAVAKAGCHYILSDTSTKANSAVVFHLKNGFKIVGFESYRSTDYWSYVFRMQLTSSFLWENVFFRIIHFMGSFLFIKVTRNMDGSDTWFGKQYKRLREICTR